MDEITLPDAIEPNEWFIVFHPKARTRWISWLACGKFKHVSAFAYCPGFRVWLIYDAQWSGMRLFLVSAAAAKAMLGKYTACCAIVKFTPWRHPMPLTSRLAYYCVPAIKHLLGVRCASWRPDGLYVHLLRNGGQLIDGRHVDTINPGRS